MAPRHTLCKSQGRQIILPFHFMGWGFFPVHLYIEEADLGKINLFGRILDQKLQFVHTLFFDIGFSHDIQRQKPKADLCLEASKTSIFCNTYFLSDLFLLIVGFQKTVTFLLVHYILQHGYHI